ncbi:MAG TPA: hypothetical protein P5181_06275 [Dermatophilaceae bacterium]|nr:hypothetical protein [Dermatophilaceae bacterium]
MVDVLGVLVVRDDESGAAVLEDVADLVSVQPGVDRHGAQAGVPHGIQGLEVCRPVAHDDCDSIALRDREVRDQSAGDGGDRLASCAQVAWMRSPSAMAGASGRCSPCRWIQEAGFIGVLAWRQGRGDPCSATYPAR